MTLRDDLLGTVRDGRALVEELGLRRHAVTRRVVTWSGGQPGLGTQAASDLVIAGARVSGPSGRDVALLSDPSRIDSVLTVTKITPAYADGGYTPAQLSPTLSSDQELVYVVTGDDGVDRLCRLETLRADRPFEYSLVLREYRETP